MDFYGLTKPIIININNDIMDEIKQIYDNLEKVFINSDTNRYLNGEFIYIKNQYVYNMRERFLHCISMKDKEFYSMYPCNNDISFIQCFTKCKVYNSPDAFKELNRSLCMYRLSRVHWVPEVINYANKHSDYIQT